MVIRRLSLHQLKLPATRPACFSTLEDNGICSSYVLRVAKLRVKPPRNRASNSQFGLEAEFRSPAQPTLSDQGVAGVTAGGATGVAPSIAWQYSVPPALRCRVRRFVRLIGSSWRRHRMPPLAGSWAPGGRAHRHAPGWLLEADRWQTFARARSRGGDGSGPY
jgi:hypothetical protein